MLRVSSGAVFSNAPGNPFPGANKSFRFIKKTAAGTSLFFLCGQQFCREAIDFENVAGKEFAKIALRERVAAYGFFLIVFFCGSVSAF